MCSSASGSQWPARPAACPDTVKGVVRSFSARWLPRAAGLDAVAIVTGVRNLVLLGAFITVPFAAPHLGSGTRGVAVAVTLGVSVASWIYAFDRQFYLAALFGVFMSVVFNYSVTRVFTWR